MAKGTKQDPIRVTDKAETKLLQCSYPGCDKWLECTKFESADRARCPEHKGKTPPSFRGETLSPAEDAPPSTSLRELLCPLCESDEPMKLIRVQEKMGFLTFRCQDSRCATAVEIKPDWANLIIDNVPEEMRPVLEEMYERYDIRDPSGFIASKRR